MDWGCGQKSLLQFSVFALALVLFGTSYWKQVLIVYIGYRLLMTNYFYRVYATLPRDISGLMLLLRVKWNIRKRLKANRPFHEIFLENVRSNPNKEAIIEVDTGRRLNFEQFNALANQYAHFFQEEGFLCNDVISIFMENGADFVALWLGLSKLGVISAWINSHLKLEPLAHSIRTANSNAIVTVSSLLPILESVFEKGLLERCKVYVVDDLQHTPNNVFPIRNEVLHRATDEPETPPSLKFRSVLCYIYTSGTTGNPKPAVIKHFRFYWMAMGCGKSFGILPNDRMYITMPMYHSAAGIVGIGQTLIQGCTAVVRKKFSASNFWKDSLKYECTASQYIGEICRYLLAQKETPEEKLHKIRVMYGNGLRAELWSEFVNRFNIAKIGELYGSTEGNSNIVNIDNRVGACGFFPIYKFLTPLYPVRLLKIDEETGEILRGENGLCIPCRPGETGEMVGVIRDNDLLLRFEGYVSSEETKKKIIRNALRQGDAVFSSGDVMYWDELGYLYFKDRRGDTFRWKGENVSTTEVEGILQPIKTVAHVTVYGVEVPKKEGRAGMAAVVPQNGVPHDQLLREIASRLTESLPSYAIPVFLRFYEEVDMTGTFKLRKANLQQEGFSLERCRNDPVYYWDSSNVSYRRLDERMQRLIEDGIYNRI